MRIADPRPSLCTLCGNAGTPDTRYVDCEAVREGPQILDAQTGTIALDPRTGALVTLEDVYVCEPCGRNIAELFGTEPTLHTLHLEEIRRGRAEIEELQDTVARLRAAIGEQAEVLA